MRRSKRSFRQTKKAFTRRTSKTAAVNTMSPLRGGIRL